MGILAVCAALHVALVELIGSPWWTPNLTAVGLVMAVGRDPGRWLSVSVLAGGWTALWWDPHAASGIAVGALASGGLLAVGARVWDGADVRIQTSATALLSACMAAIGLWTQGLWSLPLAALALAHVAVTSAAVPVARLAGRARLEGDFGEVSPGTGGGSAWPPDSAGAPARGSGQGVDDTGPGVSGRT
ncbi:MAG TPA: hypothetical protein VGB20_05260 [bacterium]